MTGNPAPLGWLAEVVVAQPCRLALERARTLGPQAECPGSPSPKLCPEIALKQPSAPAKPGSWAVRALSSLVSGLLSLKRL